MKLDTAYICLDCKEIFEGARRGACSVCTSGEVWPISRLIQSAEEREVWFERIKTHRRARGKQGRGAVGRL